MSVLGMDYESALQDAQVLVDPYPLYRRMRAEAPVYQCVRAGVWVVMRYADIVSILTDTRFGAAHRFGPIAGKGSAWLVNCDGEEHRHFRGYLRDGLLAQATGAFDSQVEIVAHEQALGLANCDSFDVIADFAEPLVLSMTAWLIIGQPRWPADLAARISTWVRDFTRLTGTLNGQSLLSEVRRGVASVRACTELCRNLLALHRTFPRSALAYRLGNLVAAERMDSEHAAGLLTEMIFATYKNVVNAIGNAVLAFFEFPDQSALFLSRQVSPDAAVDELLRYDSAVQFTTRIAQEDVQFGHQFIRKGTRVLLYLGSGNRDESVFDAPDVLNIQRVNSKTLSFAHGEHYCLGARLAKREIAMAIRVLSRQFPNLRPTPNQTVQYATPAYRGLQRLVVSCAR